MTVVGVAVAVVLVAGLATASFTALGLWTDIGEDAVRLDDEVSQPPALGPYEGAFSVLIVGTDECEPELVDMFPGRCTGADADGRRNDVNLLVHVSDSPRRITVISFPRDLQVTLPECIGEDGTVHSEMRTQSINTAYSDGGLNCVVNTVAELSERRIEFAAKASFGNVIAITEAIGGVEVCIGEGGLTDPEYTGIDWPEGPRVVQGEEALQFLRVRSGVGDGSDLARIGNQQQYLSSLTRKLTTGGVLSDPAAVLRLATAAAANITPSESLVNPIRIVQLALAAKDVPTSDITFVQFPVLDDPANAAHVVPDPQGARELWDALAQNRPLELTGEPGSNSGVTEVLSEQPAPPAPAASASAPPAPTAEAIPLSENTNGSKASQVTCSSQLE